MDTLQAVACPWCHSGDCDCAQAEAQARIHLEARGVLTDETLRQAMARYATNHYASLIDGVWKCRGCRAEVLILGKHECWSCGYDGKELREAA